MAYDPDLDVVAQELGPVPETDMIAQVRAYDGGDPKLCIFRVVGQKGRLAKVLRIPLEEAPHLGLFLAGLVAESG